MLICYYYIFRPSFCYRLPEFSGSTQGSMEPTAVPWPKARSTCCTVTGTSWQKGCGMCWPGTTPPRNCTHFKATGVRRHKTKMKGTACCLGCLPEDGFCGMWDFTIHKSCSELYWKCPRTTKRQHCMQELTIIPQEMQFVEHHWILSIIQCHIVIFQK